MQSPARRVTNLVIACLRVFPELLYFKFNCKLASFAAVSPLGAAVSHIGGAVTHRKTSKLPVGKEPLQDFTACIPNEIAGKYIWAISNYKLTTGVEHEFVVLTLADEDCTPSSLSYLRIDRGPGYAPPELSMKAALQLANALHPRAHDTFVLANNKSKVVVGAEEGHPVTTGPGYALITPVPLHKLRTLLTIFRIFSPNYIMGKEQCFWLCSCITFVSVFATSDEAVEAERPVAWLAWKMEKFKHGYDGGVVGSTWGIKIKQDHDLTKLIAQIANLVSLVNARTDTIPASAEEEWRLSGLARPLQAFYSSCEDPDLKVLAAKGLALSVTPSLRSYIFVNTIEVLDSLFEPGSIGNRECDPITIQGLLCIVRASHIYLQKLLAPDSHDHDPADPPGLTQSPSVMKEFSSSLFAKADNMLGNAVMDPAVKTLAHIVGSTDGCRLVVEKRPRVVTSLINVVQHCLKPVSSLRMRPSDHLLEAATSAIRNITTLEEGRRLLGQQNALQVLAQLTSSGNEHVQSNAKVAIANLEQPLTAMPICLTMTLESQRLTTTTVVKTALNLASFSRPANIERNTWIQGVSVREGRKQS